MIYRTNKAKINLWVTSIKVEGEWVREREELSNHTDYAIIGGIFLILPFFPSWEGSFQ